jgi:hypothetical protein
MRIGPTATRQLIQAPPQWGKAKLCTTSGVKAFEEPASLKVGSTHTNRAARPSPRKRTPGAIYA